MKEYNILLSFLSTVLGTILIVVITRYEDEDLQLISLCLFTLIMIMKTMKPKGYGNPKMRRIKP